ncbi:uncharacterized protein I303_103342 [Kwoniella dejecticola CBS 10117]|uniref:Peroxisomal membrane protein PEX11 n=1 Tax=Kwoniella dejecticola CBS 10117 TaxID=1296121 RepID=A0A1A6A6H6_9TREE|nr:uncharacterized protein I303_03365 [Kwoniella dejecticola CBS 10117]OBR85654.1 hypothetical protein I303_03365 [Kwoniella dejecticola CBS 10117]
MSTSTSTSTSTSMSIPPLPISLDHSWRSDSPRRNVNGKEREVIWDVSHTPNGLDALGLSVHDEDESSYTGGSKARSYSDHDYTRNIQRAKDLDKKKDRDKEHGPLSVDVLARIVDTSNGRDKVLKCIQYSLRTYLYLLTIVAKIRPLSPWFRSNAKRMKLAISGLSLTRKCLLLFNPLHPLSDLLSPDPMSARTLIGHLIDLVSALSDDIACFSRLGFINKRVGGKADDWANRFWLLTTLMGLYKLHFKTIPKLSNSPSSYSSNTTSLSLEKRRAELNDAKWTNRKLLADLIFVGYDVLELNFGIIEEPMKCATGLFAALISTFKLYNKHWEASIGKG